MSSALVTAATFGMTVQATSKLTVELQTNTAPVAMTVSALSRVYTAGTGSGQINNYTTDDHTLAGAASKTYDLDDNAVITNINGELIAYSKIKFILILNKGDNALVVDGTLLGLTTDNDEIEAGGSRRYDFGLDGRTVTAATTDELTITSASGTDYEILFAGVGA